MLESASKAEQWRRRLFVPNYQVREAARYARISPRTVVEWHKSEDGRTLLAREKRAALSYMQLIEVAVVSAFRKTGVPLKHIKAAREYMGKQFESEYPFAEYSFKTDGKRLFIDYAEIAGPTGNGKLTRPDQNGQLAWDSIIGRLSEFDYERNGIVVRWHVNGHDSPISIDPRIAFGAPAVRGTPTWVLRGRWDAGESIDEVGQDFALRDEEIIQALEFEGVDLSGARKASWKH